MTKKKTGIVMHDVPTFDEMKEFALNQARLAEKENGYVDLFYILFKAGSDPLLLPFDEFDTLEKRIGIYRFVTDVIAYMQPDSYALVAPAFMGSSAGGIPPSKNPNRKKILMISAFDPGNAFMWQLLYDKTGKYIIDNNKPIVMSYSLPLAENTRGFEEGSAVGNIFFRLPTDPAELAECVKRGGAIVEAALAGHARA